MIKNLLSTLFLCFLMTSAFGQSVGIIGSATPGGWDADTDMVLIDNVDSIWSIDITLFDGEAKFRLDDDWTVNWGSSDFPAGIGEQDGSNIPIFAGDYTVTFNSITGEYNFDVDSDIGIIGSATPGGWDEDTDMYKDPSDPNKFFVMLDLVSGEAKFRKDDDWTTNWGSADFPSGIGTQDGANIIVDQAANYLVSLDTSTGEYLFESMVTYETVGIIGNATPGGWDEDTDMMQDPNDPNQWSVIITLTDGEAKFRAEDDWIINWGAEDFPTGVAELGGPNIPVTAGDYLVSFNSETGEYNFKAIVEFNTVGIIGDATPGGWAMDTDLEKDPDDVHLWSARVVLFDGEAKFRAEDDWTVNWGAGDFPSGLAIQDGANIPVTAGEYIITFNSLSGAYDFKAIVEYNTVGLIGLSGPNGDWENDYAMDKDAADFNIWTASSVTLTDADPEISEQGVKFRAENDWTVNWGAVDFPGGVGTQGGPNILSVAGTYNVTFNSSNGEYVFSEPNSTKETFINPASITIFPNPASDILAIDIKDVKLEGDVSVRIIDITGKLVKATTGTTKNIDISDLNIGQYLVQVSNGKYIIGKKLSIVR